MGGKILSETCSALRSCWLNFLASPERKPSRL